MRHLPEVARAWKSGQISGAHVDALVVLRRPGTEAALKRDESLLVRQAQRLRFEHFARALASWDHHADPEGTEDAEMARRERRDVFLASSFEGMWLGRMTLDPISGAIVSTELERLEAELFEEDWGKAKAELGREPKAHELWRSPPQRRSDALVEMATRSKSTPEGARRPEPLFSVLVGYETLAGRICQLAQGAALAPGSLVPWLERAVFEPAGRVEVAASARIFTGATRRAIELRDRDAPTPTATSRRHAARPITSSRTHKTARPPRRRAASCAPSTTGCAISDLCPTTRAVSSDCCRAPHHRWSVRSLDDSRHRCCALDQWEVLGQPDILEMNCPSTWRASLIETAKTNNPNMMVGILSIRP